MINVGIIGCGFVDGAQQSGVQTNGEDLSSWRSRRLIPREQTRLEKHGRVAGVFEND